jgi:hypothetical protein
MRRRHFAQCAASLAGVLLPAGRSVALAAGGQGEELLVDACRALGALAAIHPTSNFLIPLLPPAPPPGREKGDNAAGGALGSGTALSLLGELTLECLSAGALNVDAEGTAAGEAGAYTRPLFDSTSDLFRPVYGMRWVASVMKTAHVELRRGRV